MQYVHVAKVADVRAVDPQIENNASVYFIYLILVQ